MALSRNAIATQRIAAGILFSVILYSFDMHWHLQTVRGRVSGNLNSFSAAHLRLHARRLPPHMQALAILLPLRQYSTEPSTEFSRQSGSFPPPGFNAGQAKRPLPRDPTKDSASSAASAATGSVSEGQTGQPEMLSGKTGDTIPAAKAQEAAETTVAKKQRLTVGQKFKKEVQHYWDGTKLLAMEVRISTKLGVKMAAGYELSRRENRQVGSWSFGRFKVLILAAPTYRPRLRSPGSILNVCSYTVCRTSSSSCVEALS